MLLGFNFWVWEWCAVVVSPENRSRTLEPWNRGTCCWDKPGLMFVSKSAWQHCCDTWICRLCITHIFQCSFQTYVAHAAFSYFFIIVHAFSYCKTTSAFLLQIACDAPTAGRASVALSLCAAAVKQERTSVWACSTLFDIFQHSPFPSTSVIICLLLLCCHICCVTSLPTRGAFGFDSFYSCKQASRNHGGQSIA